MTKKLTLYILLVFLVLFLISCSKKPDFSGGNPVESDLNNSAIKDATYFYLLRYPQSEYNEASASQVLTGLVYAKGNIEVDYSPFDGSNVNSIFLIDGALVSVGDIKYVNADNLKEVRFVFDPYYLQLRKSKHYLRLIRVYYTQNRGEIAKKDNQLLESGGSIPFIEEEFSSRYNKPNQPSNQFK